MLRVSLALPLLAALPALAQWPRVAPAKLPRTADGKVNMLAPTPRDPEGHPDLSGVWEMYSEQDMPRLLINLAFDLKPGARCLPSGIPEKDMVPAPYKIIQIPGLIVFLYESRTIFRQIFTDGRPLPGDDPNPAWQGYSIGHWEGDTLVVETADFKDKGWLDMAGHPASESLHVFERFTRRDLGHMDLQVTIHDPKTYTKDWTVNAKIHLLPQDELIEHICEENNKDPAHLVGK